MMGIELLHQYPEEGMMKRQDRLTKPRQYASVYDNGSSWPSGLIVIKALPNNQDFSRYGISVSKKVGNAVTRNRIKRRLREIIRLQPVKQGWDIVYVIRPAAAEADFYSIKESIEILLSRADLVDSQYLQRLKTVEFEEYTEE